MVSTVNVNIFSPENVAIINKIDSIKENSKAELELVSILEKKENITILDYDASDRSNDLLTRLKNIEVKSINYEPAFANENILFLKDKESIDFKSDVVVSINAAIRKADIKKYLGEILSIDAQEYYVVIPCSDIIGMNSNDDIRVERLENNSMFINNLYSHKAINEIAKSLNMNATIFKSDKSMIDSCILMLNKSAIKPVKSKK